MAKKSDIEPQDRALFRNTIGSVKRLHHDRVEHPGSSPPPVPRYTDADERQVLIDMVSSYFDPAELETGDEIAYCSDGLQHAVLRKLRRGQFKVGAVLDLHGMTVPMARQALTEFLHRARLNHITCVRIIHGKGNRSRHRGPVLKQKTSQWLQRRDEVLAFCSARPMDGGTGAIYVLLKRRL